MTLFANAQNKQGIYVDRFGVIRWEKDHAEAAFFGTNYTVPFAYGYRSIHKLGQNVEQAIKDDVYHFSRLGFDAFRVHVWDQEISDVNGNLRENEHLRLFDLLVAELKKRKIKTLITPIAFWGNGYPERDENTGSFSYRYGKQNALVEEVAFKAQENFLRQFFSHRNPYTGLTYQEDVDVLAAEVNNEPKHSGEKERATEYVNRMVTAIKGTGWTKPIFYNISESPWYASAIVKSNVTGHTFQWYPTGLVAGHTLQGNFLPNVAKYTIPFDTIAAFKNRAKIVYEFDAGDVMTPIMYPAMARSFRVAGFQWATQFAYDPMATAYGNTEYQTHYLNLAYTPSKAISMLIASKVFHQTKRLDNLSNGNVFGPFKIDYQTALSEMNSETEFYYSNSTASIAKNGKKLAHVAGVGSSEIVRYQGTGAYFLDRIANGVWRLEVMPDAIAIKDPFEKASPNKTVTAINWVSRTIDIRLPDLGEDFTVKGLNHGNTVQYTAAKTMGNVSPGSYLLARKGVNPRLSAQHLLSLAEFVAPQASNHPIFVQHKPLLTASVGVPLPIKAQVVGLGHSDSVFVQVTGTNRRKRISLSETAPYAYTGTIPSDLVTVGILRYEIIIRKKDGETITFPTNEKYDFDAWDRLEVERYETHVAAKGAIIELFNANRDSHHINIYNPDWANHKVAYVSAENPMILSLNLAIKPAQQRQLMGFQSYFADQLVGRKSELEEFRSLVIRVKSNVDAAKIKLGLIDVDAHFFSHEITATRDFRDIVIPLKQLKTDAQLLLPRPYPGFLPLYFTADAKARLDIKNAEQLEVTFGDEPKNTPIQIYIETIYLK